jgi:hypothetical protein
VHNHVVKAASALGGFGGQPKLFWCEAHGWLWEVGYVRVADWADWMIWARFKEMVFLILIDFQN